MSESATPIGRRSVVRRRLIVTVVLLLVIAAIVYFKFIQERGPRPLKLAPVTWTEDPFWEPLIRGAQDCANQSGVELIVVRSKPTVEAQTQHVRELLKSGVDGIAISPNDLTAQREILDGATSKVPVVTFDTDAPDTKRRRFVSIDNYAAGRLLVGEMTEAMPEGGPVIISVGSATMQHGRERRQGVIDAVLERGFDRNRAADPLDVPLKGPKFTVVATATDGGDPAKAVESIAAALKAHPEVKGVFGLFSYSAPAALVAMKRVGRSPGEFKVVGFDASDETQASLATGEIHSSVIQESYRCGAEAIRVLADEVRGEPRGVAEFSSTLYVGINVITGKDLDKMRQSGVIRDPATQPSPQPVVAR